MVKEIFGQNNVNVWYMEIPLFVRNIISYKNLSEFATKKNYSFSKKDFGLDFLSDGELQVLNGYKSLKKQIEWISGRFLVKHMVKELVDEDVEFCKVAISYKKEGAPFIGRFPFVNISITHSGHYAAAALSLAPGKIGIDIEKADYAPSESFMNIAFSMREISEIDNIDSITCETNETKSCHCPEKGTDLFTCGSLSYNNSNESAHVFRKENYKPHDIMRRWTIKEAFLKYIGMGFNEKLKSVEILDNSVFYNGNKVTDIIVRSFMIDDSYLLSMISG